MAARLAGLADATLRAALAVATTTQPQGAAPCRLHVVLHGCKQSMQALGDRFYRHIGVNEWAGRLPSAFAALGTVLVVYELARRMFSKSTALLAGIVLASTPLILPLR